MDCQHPVGILPVRVFRRNRDTADSAHRLPQATVRRAGRAEDTSVCSASPWRYGLQARIISHDRYFLDEIVDKIWELKDGKITEYWGNYSDYLRQKEEERKSQAAEYEQFIAERARLERAAEEKRKQARKIEQKAKGASKKKSTEGGGRLAHQKSIGSKEKKMHNAAKSLEHRIAALGNVEAPEDIRRIRFRQSKALELHNPYPYSRYGN